jgi:hypothetical protein
MSASYYLCNVELAILMSVNELVTQCCCGCVNSITAAVIIIIMPTISALDSRHTMHWTLDILCIALDIHLLFTVLLMCCRVVVSNAYCSEDSDSYVIWISINDQ